MEYAVEGSRGDVVEVIVEAFVKFNWRLLINKLYSFFVLCHRQERGDYQESWQPATILDKDLYEAKDMAEKVTEALGGAGLWC
jgi:phosphoribosylglycinamide formyltransferase 2